MKTTVWITKYALTKDIQKADGVEILDGYASRHPGQSLSADYLFVRMGTDAFESETEARENATRRATRKLGAIDKQREKIEKLIAAWRRNDAAPSTGKATP